MKLFWYPAVSLDGYITDVHGSSDFVTPEDTRQFAKLVNSSGALIVGRHTFDQYHRPNPFPKITTYVMTGNHKLVSEDPAIVYVVGGPFDVLRRIHNDGHVTAVLSGGGLTNGAFAAKGLIDEAWISVYPLVHGNGVPLLGDYRGILRFSLKEGFMLPGGIVHNRYDVG